MLGTDRRLTVEVFTSPGGYILGEESALIECMEGHRGEPRNKPPFPGIYGLHGLPTLMNSVETFADVPAIVARGGEWWKTQGVRGSTGLKFFAVSGDVVRPGVYCVPLGTTARELIERAGGLPEGVELQAFQPGGASSNFLGPDQLDVPLDFKPLAEAGSMLGSGALVAIGDRTNLLAAATNVLRFFRNESCGKCVPCRVGSHKAHQILTEALARGTGTDGVDGQIARARGDAPPHLDMRARPGGAWARDERARPPARWEQRPAASSARARGPAARQRPVDVAATGREFFTVKTVSEALTTFRPHRRTATETIGLDAAFGRVPAGEVRARDALPGFDRSSVDGYAVRARDTFGASESIPSYLRVTGAVRMGAAADEPVAPGAAVSIPTGGMLPAGADAIVMIEHTQEAMPGTIEVVRPVAPGDGIVRGNEDVVAGETIAGAGRPLRAQDVAMLAAAGVLEIAVHRRPLVTILATGDEVDPPDTPALRPGHVRDALSVSIGALVREAGGEPAPPQIVPDEGSALRDALKAAISHSDVVVVCAGSSVGARDETAGAIAALPGAETWCHGLAIKPGKPTLLAHADGIPIVGLPGNPRSALVVFRLIGMPLVRLVGGWTIEPRAGTAQARLSRDVPSAAGRLDVVQVRVDGEGVAEPIFGPSALLSVLTAADGFVIVPEDANGLTAGEPVEVVLYG